MSDEPSRTVTRRSRKGLSATCPVCGGKFTRKRRDAKTCSSACRQRMHRGRAGEDRLRREIEATRRRYWQLVAQLRAHDPATITKLARFVDEQGNVFRDGVCVGKTAPVRPGWAGWGLEAAGPPFCPPPCTPPKPAREA